VEQVLVERDVREHPRTLRILRGIDAGEIREIGGLPDLLRSDFRPAGNGSAWAIARYPGRLLQKCPGTQRHICCGYKVLNIQTGCDLGCTYCILQGYLNSPLITIYVNLEDALQEVDRELSNHPDRFYRIGTGELTDSLFVDSITGISRELVDFFSRQSNAILELKTKTDNVEHLLDLDPRGRVILSWSLNPQQIVDAEEGSSAPLANRIRAAVRAQEAGYRLGFHFDPLIYFPGWREAYEDVVNALFDQVDPGRIAWISLGALRYPPYLDRLIRERHPQSPLPLGELFPGKDGKLRYLRHIRVEMFRTLHEFIRRRSSDVFVYLCMESDLVWRESFGWSPRHTAGLARLLDERARMGLR